MIKKRQQISLADKYPTGTLVSVKGVKNRSGKILGLERVNPRGEIFYIVELNRPKSQYSINHRNISVICFPRRC